MHRIRKGQFKLGKLRINCKTASEIWNAVSPHEPRNVPERFAAPVVKVCTTAVSATSILIKTTLDPRHQVHQVRARLCIQCVIQALNGCRCVFWNDLTNQSEPDFTRR